VSPSARTSLTFLVQTRQGADTLLHIKSHHIHIGASLSHFLPVITIIRRALPWPQSYRSPSLPIGCQIIRGKPTLSWFVRPPEWWERQLALSQTSIVVAVTHLGRRWYKLHHGSIIGYCCLEFGIVLVISGAGRLRLSTKRDLVDSSSCRPPQAGWVVTAWNMVVQVGNSRNRLALNAPGPRQCCCPVWYLNLTALSGIEN